MDEPKPELFMCVSEHIPRCSWSAVKSLALSPLSSPVPTYPGYCFRTAALKVSHRPSSQQWESQSEEEEADEELDGRTGKYLFVVVPVNPDKKLLTNDLISILIPELKARHLPEFYGLNNSCSRKSS